MAVLFSGTSTAIILILYVLWRLFTNTGPRLPKGVPIIGAREGDWFPFWQATLRNSLDVKGAALEAYANYKDKTAILPVAGPGGATLVVLPVSETQFVTEQPESVLNLREVINAGLLYKYTVSDHLITSHPVHQKLVALTLTNQIGNLLDALVDETAWSFNAQWGSDTENFRDICVWDSLGRIVASVTNRAFVGLPHCRDPVLLDSGFAFARVLPLSARLLSFVWAPLRPLAAPLITLPNRYYERRFTGVLLPEVKKRLCSYRVKGPGEEKASDGEANDFLQWTIEQAIESGHRAMWEPRTLAGRILLLNLVSIHTSSLTVTNVLLDLASSKREYIDELRAEVTSCLTETGGVWTKAALSKMEKLDSVFRESARLNTLVAVGLRRRVVAKEGVTTPSGVHIPYGNICAVPSLGVLTDDDKYPAAGEFHPFRFVELRQQINSGNRPEDHVQRSRMSFPATSCDYLAFGNGRQACPGRFFAAAELKLMLGYMLLHYDIEMLDKRPPDKWIGILRIPPPDAKVRVRRRRAADIPSFMFPPSVAAF